MTDTAGALLALLAADVNLKVYDGKVPVDTSGHPPTRPYVAFYSPDPLAVVYNLAGVSGREDATYQTTVVGDEAQSVRVIQSRVKAALLDVTPSVTGRLCFPIRQDYSNPALRDDDLVPPVMYATVGWHVASIPST